MILAGAASPTVFPRKGSASTVFPRKGPERNEEATSATATGVETEHGTAPSAPASSSSGVIGETDTDKFESGLALFASIAAPALSDPQAVECNQLRRALSEKETEIQDKNLLLLRTKEALIQLNERLAAATRERDARAEETRAAQEALVAMRCDIDDKAARIDSLTCSLQDALDEGARSLREARKEWENESQHLSDDHVTLAERLAASEKMTASLRAKMCVLEASANERECALRRQLTQVKEQAAAERHHAETERARAEAISREKLEEERASRKHLAERVAVTEDAVMAQMKQKEAEVEALQLRVDSHQKHLRRLATPSTTPSSSTASTHRTGNGSRPRSSVQRKRTGSGGRAKRQLVVQNKLMDKENATPRFVGAEFEFVGENKSNTMCGPVGVVSPKKKKKTKKKAKKKTGLSVRSESTNLTRSGITPKVRNRKKRRGRQVASRYLTSSMR